MNLQEKALAEYNAMLEQEKRDTESQHQYNTHLTEHLFITTFQTHPDNVDGFKDDCEQDNWLLVDISRLALGLVTKMNFSYSWWETW